jgi:double-strand break repair protein MRE11
MSIFLQKDLPIFSIHGNHDDPTRDGGTEMLAALDLLSVSNLVNYFGRHDEVDKVEVSPILIRKGSTRVALYGMGSMRDERLNRMWQGKKVRFLRPEVDAEDDDDEENAFFNIFALHQNRDLGRGSKNCVHESMIPEWMDLVSPTHSFVLAQTCTNR